MSTCSFSRLLVIFCVVTLFAAGCAKKPVPEAPAMTEQPAVSEMQEQQPAAIKEEPVDEAAASRAAAEAAEAAARKAASGLMRIYFDFDQYVLTSEAKGILAQDADLLKSAPSVKVQIEGHCDERGSDEYNLALGEKRALATKNYLVSLGIAPERMSVISYGEEMPLDPAHTEAAWAKNRRAEFKAQR